MDLAIFQRPKAEIQGKILFPCAGTAAGGKQGLLQFPQTEQADLSDGRNGAPGELLEPGKADQAVLSPIGSVGLGIGVRHPDTAHRDSAEGGHTVTDAIGGKEKIAIQIQGEYRFQGGESPLAGMVPGEGLTGGIQQIFRQEQEGAAFAAKDHQRKGIQITLAIKAQ